MRLAALDVARDARGMSTAQAPKISEADYLEVERSAETRHEFVNGELIAMAGGTPAHAHVIGEVYVALRGKLGSSGCIPTTGDQRIHVPATGLYAYPDVSVFCGRPERHPTDANTLVNPAMIVEVLSPSASRSSRASRASCSTATGARTTRRRAWRASAGSKAGTTRGDVTPRSGPIPRPSSRGRTLRPAAPKPRGLYGSGSTPNSAAGGSRSWG